MMTYENGLRMPLEELRASININKNIWEHTTTTNCYAYALGLDVCESDIMEYAYEPGTMGNSQVLFPNNEITYLNLIKNLYIDLAFLGIDFREVNPLEKTGIDEWKIALFTSLYYGKIEDYHFLRQSENGIWYHKEGWIDRQPTKYDNMGGIIINPADCCLYDYSYRKCLCLKLRR